MSIFSFTKKVIEKKVEQQTPKAYSIPMGLDLGKVFTISPVVFALVDDSLVMPTDSRENIICAVSSLKAGNGARVGYRAYVKKGDSDTEPEQYLQVTSDEADFECIWFTRLHRHYPQTTEDMEAFMGKGYGSGEREFNISRGMLEGLGFDTKVLDNVYKNEDTLVYTREIGDADYVSPIEQLETRVDSKDCESGLTQKSSFMLYSRILANGTKEFLWISLEVEQSKNGVKSDEVHVDFMVGLKVDSNRIKVI